MTPSRFAVAGLALLVAGCLVAAFGTATAADAIGIAIAGIGGVLLVSAAFLAVGLSEDRERANRTGPDR
jgi:hypothetical protein